MEKIIEFVLTVEEQAQAMVAKARESRDAIIANIDEDIEAKREIIKDKAQRIINANIRNDQEEIQEKIKEINKSSEEQLQEMQKTFQENKSKWVNAVLSEVIGS